MEKVNQIWLERRSEFWKTASRYLKLLGNSGFMFSLYILILAGGVYYQKWVSGLSDSFPTEWILTIVFAVLAYRSPIRTFLESADLVFLLPLENQMAGYFKKSVVYSAIFQSVGIVFTWAILMPLYLHTVSPSPVVYFIVLLLILGVKVWNIDAVWREHFILNAKSYDFLRGIFTVVFIGCVLFMLPWWGLAIMIILMFLLSLFVFHPLSNHLLKWEKVLDSEERLMERFYRLANLITDVPKMSQRMKPRRYLNGLTDFYPYGQKAVFKKFYLKTFMRSGEYFGIWVRLVVIGIVVMALLPKGITTIILAVVFTYLTAIQIAGLWKERLSGPTMLFPLSSQVRKNGFLNVLMSVLITQAVVYGLAALVMSGNLMLAGTTILCGLILCFGFIYGYASRGKKGTDAL